MAVDVRLPQIAVDTHEGTLVRWIIKVGDSVNQGDPIAEVETAKTVIEVDAPSSGTLLATVADEGANIVIPGILAYMEISNIPWCEAPSAPVIPARSIQKITGKR